MFFKDTPLTQPFQDVSPFIVQGVGRDFYRTLISQKLEFSGAESNPQSGVVSIFGCHVSRTLTTKYALIIANKSGLTSDPGGDWASVCDLQDSLHFGVWDSRTMVCHHPAFEPFLQFLREYVSERKRETTELQLRADQIPFCAFYPWRLKSKTFSNNPTMDLWNESIGVAYKGIVPPSHRELLGNPDLKAYLPSMVGSIVSVRDQYPTPNVEFQKIGDGCNFVKIPRENEPWQVINPSQNLGEDIATLRFLEKLSQRYPTLMLDDLRKLPEFRNFLIKSYKDKTSRVPVIDGWEESNLNANTNFSRVPVYDDLLVAAGSDGWTLGNSYNSQQLWLTQVEQVVRNISSESGLNPEIEGQLVGIGKSRRLDQARTYRQDPPFSQERPHDDLILLMMYLKKENNLDRLIKRDCGNRIPVLGQDFW